MTSLFTAIYMLMPNTSVRIMPALVGGLVAGICWAATGKVFTAMVIYTSRLTLVYAGFAVVIARVPVDLPGLADPAGRRAAGVLHPEPATTCAWATRDFDLSCNEQERLALDIMARVAMEHRAGNPPWTLEKLTRALALPGIAIAAHGGASGARRPAGAGG